MRAPDHKMPEPGILYPRVGRGYITLHVRAGNQVWIRVMHDPFDVGVITGPITVARFWEQVAPSADSR